MKFLKLSLGVFACSFLQLGCGDQIPNPNANPSSQVTDSEQKPSLEAVPKNYYEADAKIQRQFVLQKMECKSKPTPAFQKFANQIEIKDSLVVLWEMEKKGQKNLVFRLTEEDSGLKMEDGGQFTHQPAHFETVYAGGVGQLETSGEDIQLKLGSEKLSYNPSQVSAKVKSFAQILRLNPKLSQGKIRLPKNFDFDALVVENDIRGTRCTDDEAELSFKEITDPADKSGDLDTLKAQKLNPIRSLDPDFQISRRFEVYSISCRGNSNSVLKSFMEDISLAAVEIEIFTGKRKDKNILGLVTHGVNRPLYKFSYASTEGKLTPIGGSNIKIEVKNPSFITTTGGTPVLQGIADLFSSTVVLKFQSRLPGAYVIQVPGEVHLLKALGPDRPESFDECDGGQRQITVLERL